MTTPLACWEHMNHTGVQGVASEMRNWTLRLVPPIEHINWVEPVFVSAGDVNSNAAKTSVV